MQPSAAPETLRAAAMFYPHRLALMEFPPISVSVGVLQEQRKAVT